VSTERHLIGKIKSLHQPIEVAINGQPCTMLTVGYVARALGRITWTLRYWTKIGLFPSTPFYWDPSATRIRFRLYPEAIVERLGEIIDAGYLGNRLDRESRVRFHEDVLRAYRETITPLLSPST